VTRILLLALLLGGCDTCRESAFTGSTWDSACHPKARVEQVGDKLICRCPASGSAKP